MAHRQTRRMARIPSQTAWPNHLPQRIGCLPRRRQPLQICVDALAVIRGRCAVIRGAGEGPKDDLEDPDLKSADATTRAFPSGPAGHLYLSQAVLAADGAG